MIRKRKRQILSKGLAFFFLLTLLLQTVTVRAGEQDSYHSDVRCSLTIELKDLGTRPEHTVFDIYQVGTVEAETSLHFRLLDRYRKTGINLKRIRLAEEQEEAAAKLTGVLNEDTLVAEMESGENGVLAIVDLEQGAYLVRQKDPADYGNVAPFLVFLPYGTSEKWEYDLKVSPKADRLEQDKTPLPEMQIQTHVLPIETGDSSEEVIYVSLSVGMLCILIILVERKQKS